MLIGAWRKYRGSWASELAEIERARGRPPGGRKPHYKYIQIDIIFHLFGQFRSFS